MGGSEMSGRYILRGEGSGLIPKRWVHGYPKEAWRWSEDCGCYLHFIGVMVPPDSYCLGDRMIYTVSGKDSYGVIWSGSSSTQWHCADFGYDLKKGIDWVREADHKDRGCELWSK